MTTHALAVLVNQIFGAAAREQKLLTIEFVLRKWLSFLLFCFSFLFAYLNCAGSVGVSACKNFS